MKTERGIALVLVLVILPLVAIIMVQLHFETTISERLARNLLANQQFKQAIHARRRQMQLKLVRDLVNDTENAQQGGAYDHYSDDWGPDTEGGTTALRVTKGNAEQGDEIEIYTEVIDEQGKFNLNLLRHSDVRRRGRAFEILKNLLDFFRESRFGDLEPHEYDLDETEASLVAEAIQKFVRGEERDERIPTSELPPATAEMKQGILTVEDILFSHRLFIDKRMMERFTDVDSNQILPSFAEFITLHGDGKINGNTAPIQLLRALFRDDEGRKTVADAILLKRGGFLNNEDNQDERRKKHEDRTAAKQEGNEEELAEMDAGFKSVNDISGVEGMNKAPFLRRNDIDVGQIFTVRSNFFTLIITARRGNFMRQHRLILERHPKGVITWETQIQTADINSLPQGIPGMSQDEDAER